MYVEKEIPIYDFVLAISEAVDLVSPVLNSHHNRVAYIAYRISHRMKLPNDEIQDIVLASMLHDIGAFSTGERIKALAFESVDSELNEHALMGHKLLKNFAPLSIASTLIKYHHADYDETRDDIPLGSYIIHLADKICILFNDQTEILTQVPKLLEKLSQKAHKFHPDTITILAQLAKFEYFWLEAFSPIFNNSTLKRVLSSKKIIDLQTLRSFAKLIAQIIDFRSRFTATHSHGVAAVAQELTVISGFS